MQTCWASSRETFPKRSLWNMQDTMAIFISSQFHTVRINETLNNDREIYWKSVSNHISLCVISVKVEPCLQYISMFWQHVVLKLSWVAINKCICISHTSTIMKCIHLKVNCSCRIVFCYRCMCAFFLCNGHNKSFQNIYCIVHKLWQH